MSQAWPGGGGLLPGGPPLPPYQPPKPSSGAGRALKLALLIGLPLVVLGMGAIGGFAYLLFKSTVGPRDAAHAFLRDARKGDWDAAYDRMSPGYQDRVSRGDFEADIEADAPDAAESDDATFHSTSISGSVACLSGSLSPSNSAVFVQVNAKGNGWVIERFGSQPTPVCAHR